MHASPLTALLRDRWVRGLLASALLAHALLALGLRLSPDEAHYALYGSHLDWSYFDHPPLVGWLQWPWALLGGSDFAMRVVPMASWLLAALGLLQLTAVLYPGEPLAPRAALALLVLSPIPHLLGFALVPDTLLMPITCATMLVCWRLCDPAQLRRLPLWLALGLCLGLAGLAKYTAVLLAAGVVLALLLAHGPRPLALPGPWLAVLVALLLVTPVLGWNATHQWISFNYQLNHAAGASAWLPRRVLGFVLVQLLGYGVLLLAGLLALRAARRNVVSGTVQRLSPTAFALCFGLPPLLLYTHLSGRGSTLPHWSAPAWLALLPALAVGVLYLWQRAPRSLRALGVLQAATGLALAGLMFSAGVGTETGAQARSQPGQLLDTAPRNPFADLHGWDAAAARAATLAREQGLPTLAVMNWSLASRIAWYARPLPVKLVNPHYDQFDLWFGTLQPGESVLLVDWSLMSYAPPAGDGRFARCTLLAQQPVLRWGRQVAHFNFLRCDGWQGAAATANPHARRP